MDNAYVTGAALGSGPVRVLLADRGDVLRGRVDLGASATPGWSAMQTLWIAVPGYTGPFVVRAARLGARAPIEVKPSQTGLSPGSARSLSPQGPPQTHKAATGRSPAAPLGEVPWLLRLADRWPRIQ